MYVCILFALKLPCCMKGSVFLSLESKGTWVPRCTSGIQWSAQSAAVGPE